MVTRLGVCTSNLTDGWPRQQLSSTAHEAEPPLCQCGCGQAVPLVTWTRRGLAKGQPARLLKGHHAQRPRLRIDDDGRQCVICGEYKPWGEFYTLARGGVRGHMSDCKACRRENVRLTRDPEKRKAVARRWREANPEKYREGQIRVAARRRGLDPDMVVAHFREHHGACDICGGKPANGDRRNSRLCIDHDHETGAFRGLLCSSCNIGIGKLQDDPAVLRAAIVYLLKAGREAA